MALFLASLSWSPSPLEKKYAQNPTDISRAQLPASFATAENIALIFHGRGGPDRETDDLKARFLAQDAAVGLDRAVEVYNWEEYLEGTDRVGYTGQALGRKFGKILAQNRALRSLHVVGTSAGSFISDATCSAYVAAAGDSRACVRLSLTDPITVRGGEELGDGWGLRNFGADCDFAEHYLNTDDIVPSTNIPLQRCHVYDVTGCAERASFPPPNSGNFLQDLGLRMLGYHNWPMGYLARHYETVLDADGNVVHPTHEEKKRGEIVFVR